MAGIDDNMARMYGDIVKVVNRTDKPLEFLWDSRIHVIPVGAKGKNLPRFIAEHGCKYHATAFDTSGFPTSSLLGIEGDTIFPADKMTEQEVTDATDSDKFGSEVEVNGKIVKKQKIKLNQPKESFAVNNL